MHKFLFVPLLALIAVPAHAAVMWAPYLQGGTPTAMSVLWRSQAPVTATLTYTEETPFAQRHTVNKAAADWHEFNLSGLKPGTVYSYEALEAGKPIGTGHFRTNPGPGVSRFRFAVIGDTGSGTAHQAAVAREMTAWKPDFVLHMGDVVYERGELENYGARFFKPYKDLIARAVIYPTLGNHDYGRGTPSAWLSVFATPSENERYYTFTYGDAQFFALDTNAPFGVGTPQYKWLSAALAASASPWKFAFFHHPPFSGGEHGGSPYVKAALSPLFEKHGVQTVFAGHDHHYERINARRDFGGKPVTYLVTGGGGAYIRRVKANRTSAYIRPVYHFLGVTLDGDHLSGEAIDEEGATFDTWRTPRNNS